MPQESIESTTTGMEPNSVPSHRSDSKSRSEISPADFNWPFLITDLFNAGAEWYAKKVVELYLCDNFSVKTIRDNLKNMISCSELVLESIC